MDETLEQIFSFVLDDTGINAAIESLHITGEEATNLAKELQKPEDAYRKLGRTAYQTMKEIEDLQRIRGMGLVADKDVSSVDLMIKSKQSTLDKSEEGLDLLKKFNPNLNVKKLDKELGLSNGEDKSIKGLMKSINEVSNLLSPELLSMMGTTISTILTATTAITAITAVIKLLMEFLKEQTEWDKINAKIDAYGGTNEDAIRMANTIGEQYTKEFAGAYTLLLAQTKNNVGLADRLTNLAKEYSSIPGNDSTIETMKTFIGALQDGNASRILNVPGLNAFEKEIGSAGLDPTIKYASNPAEALVSALESSGQIGRLVNSTFANGKTLEDISKTERNIESGYEAINKVSNAIMSPMTTSKISGGNLQGNIVNGLTGKNQSNTFGTVDKNKPMPVSVIGSIMLSQETIDILTDLREHQFITQINLQHTTPIISQNNTFNNGTLGIDDLAKLNNELGELVAGDDNSGSTLYNDGGLM